MKNTLLIISALLLALMPSCTRFAPDDRLLKPGHLPEAYSLYPSNDKPSSGNWWEDFKSPELNCLIEKAFASNFDLRQSYALIKQARAGVKKQASYLFPEFSGTAGYGHTKIKGSDGVNDLSLGLAAGYELDLWGRIRSLKTAEVLNMEASIQDYMTMSMSVAATVAETWIDILALREEINYVHESVSTHRRRLSLLENRYEKGMASSMDVLNQQETLSASEALLPPLESREKELLNNLALVLGNFPETAPEISRSALPDPIPLPDTGLPADLLAMRPDVRAAGLRLTAADWQISAAKAARLPSLSLSASGVYTSETLNDLFNTWIINLAANLTGPIFDAGRRKADVMKARAVAEERLIKYKRVVYEAVLDVENALVHEVKQRDYVKALAREREASIYAYDEALRRYLSGQDTYLAVQEKILNVQSTERAMIQQEAQLVKYRIALYRALGGQWARNPETNAPSSKTQTEP